MFVINVFLFRGIIHIHIPSLRLLGHKTAPRLAADPFFVRTIYFILVWGSLDSFAFSLFSTMHSNICSVKYLGVSGNVITTIPRNTISILYWSFLVSSLLFN